eukprot:TRINITY_DN4277_c0_g1_i1.p1 TRINITY_DN4277_c0_g1~~TRINITY_DN4277_c0_g1_i1.p1  ORF type:complete len:538 (+),score=85.28 TRINITY_DN4277_c0_g1_i1:236-1615(+)
MASSFHQLKRGLSAHINREQSRKLKKKMTGGRDSRGRELPVNPAVRDGAIMSLSPTASASAGLSPADLFGLLKDHHKERAFVSDTMNSLLLAFDIANPACCNSFRVKYDGDRSNMEEGTADILQRSISSLKTDWLNSRKITGVAVGANQWAGLRGIAEWEKKGVRIPYLGTVYPRSGVFVPTQTHILATVRSLFERMEFKFAEPDEMSILDVGCGTGVLGFIANRSLLPTPTPLVQSSGLYVPSSSLPCCSVLDRTTLLLFLLLTPRELSTNYPRPRLNLEFTDLNPVALDCVKRNLHLLSLERTRVVTTLADVFPSASKKHDLILCNPPHIPLPGSTSLPSPHPSASSTTTSASNSDTSSLMSASYDVSGSFLTTFFSGVATHLAPDGVIMFVYSDIGERLLLQEPNVIASLCESNGLKIVSDELITPPKTTPLPKGSPLIQRIKEEAQYRVYIISHA